MNILLVDDEAQIRDVFRLVLETNGYYVHEAANGKDALEVLHKGSIDLVITDLNMPIMDGLALITRMVTEYPLTRVLVVSADEGALEEISWFRLVTRLSGFDKMRKPLMIRELLRKVEKLLAA